MRVMFVIFEILSLQGPPYIGKMSGDDEFNMFNVIYVSLM